MLDSIYYMTLRLLQNLISGVKNVILLSLCIQRCYGRHNVSRKSVLHGVISLPDAMSYDKFHICNQ